VKPPSRSRRAPLLLSPHKAGAVCRFGFFRFQLACDAAVKGQVHRGQLPILDRSNHVV